MDPFKGTLKPQETLSPKPYTLNPKLQTLKLWALYLHSRFPVRQSLEISIWPTPPFLGILSFWP